ncbi:MAG: hypothetical protein HYV60_05940 [Planctomycetia bacterium]|nr:hypothetical protein [Planctomycetia bacterium]
MSPFQVGIWSGMNVDIFWSHRNVEYDHYIPQVFWDRYRQNCGHGERERICQNRRQEEAKAKRGESGVPLLVIAVIVVAALMFLAAISSSRSVDTNYEGMSGEEQLRYLEADNDDRGGSPY